MQFTDSKFENLFIAQGVTVEVKGIMGYLSRPSNSAWLGKGKPLSLSSAVLSYMNFYRLSWEMENFFPAFWYLGVVEGFVSRNEHQEGESFKQFLSE